MPVSLPTSPLPWEATPRLLDFGGDLTPPLGGPAQRFSRLGSRWSVDLVFPTMDTCLAKPFLAALFKARAFGSTLLANFPIAPDAATVAGALGTPVVNGAGQTGTTLNVAGLPASTTKLKAGTFFSVVVSGRTYLYCTVADATVDGTGHSALQIAPMLRASPADGAALAFSQPQIEGFAAGMAQDWTLTRLAWTQARLTLTEIA